MDPVIRALSIYAIMLLLTRLSGRRTMAQVTVFDLVLVLVAAEAVGDALTGGNTSIMNATIVVGTLLTVDVTLSVLKNRFEGLGVALDGQPMIVLRDGELLHDRLRKARIDESDILEEARMNGGPTNVEDIRYAVLERNGKMSIIPK